MSNKHDPIVNKLKSCNISDMPLELLHIILKDLSHKDLYEITFISPMWKRIVFSLNRKMMKNERHRFYMTYEDPEVFGKRHYSEYDDSVSTKFDLSKYPISREELDFHHLGPDEYWDLDTTSHRFAKIDDFRPVRCSDDWSL